MRTAINKLRRKTESRRRPRHHRPLDPSPNATDLVYRRSGSITSILR